jgi:hypothetical protein
MAVKRWFAKRNGRLLQQVIPQDDADTTSLDSSQRPDTRYLQRPGFSLPLMTSNFRRFNARYYCDEVFLSS